MPQAKQTPPTVVRMSTEQLQELLAGLHAQVTQQVGQSQQEIRTQLEEFRIGAATPSISTSNKPTLPSNFVKCTARFNDEGQDVAAFLDAVET